MKKYYQLMILAVPLLFFLVYICSVSAASGVAAYYIDPGETYMATLDGRARKITNATSYTLFVPVRTLTEQQSFLNNLPAGVTALTNACEWETTAILWGTGYPIVGIGNQCWMAKNLNYATGSSWCYDNNASNCTTYGRLYDWSTATVACPAGWHLPTDAEQHTLESVFATGTCNESRVNMYDCVPAGTALKNGGSSGFNLLIAGMRAANGAFHGLLQYTGLWSATRTAPSTYDCVNRQFVGGREDVKRALNNNGEGMYVRCVKEVQI